MVFIVIIMKYLFFPAILLLSLAQSSCNPGKSTAQAKSEVIEFRADFNSSNLENIYDTSHSDFKAAASKEDALSFMRGVRNKLGKSISANQINWRVNSHNLQTNVVLQYQTEFEFGKGIETFTYRIENENAVLAGWHINSNDLIALLNTDQNDSKESSDAEENTDLEILRNAVAETVKK